MKETIRCSSLNQLIGCHGSPSLRKLAAEKMPELGQIFDDDGVTKSGSWTHYRAGLRLILNASAVGDLEMPAGKAPIVDSFEQWVEDFYYDTVIDITAASHAIAIEQRITVEYDLFILSGQIDCFTINAEGTEAEINDLKTGYIEVDKAESNWQLLGYLVLLLHRFPTLRRVTLRIIQPRNEPSKRISEVTVEVTPGLEATLVAEIENALTNPDDLETGRKQCRWCIAQLICPCVRKLRKEMKLKVTKAALEEIKLTPNDLLLAEWVLDGQVMSGPLDAARKLVKERIIANGPILMDDGTELSVIETNGPRKVPDAQVAKERMDEEGLNFMACVTVSMPMVEANVAKAKKLQKTSKDPAVETVPKWIEKNFSDIYEQPKQKELVIT